MKEKQLIELSKEEFKSWFNTIDRYELGNLTTAELCFEAFISGVKFISKLSAKENISETIG